MNITPEELDELIRIVHLAGVEIIKIYKNKVTKKYKSDNTPVTNADIKANDIICKGLKRHFPNISIVSEEQVKKGKATQRFWLVDPLDGTKEFLKGNGEFTVNIGLIENKKPVFGIIYMPTKNKLYFTKDKKSYFSKLSKKGNISNIKKIKVKKRNKNIVILSRSHSLAKSEVKKAKKMILKRFNANKILPDQ